MTDADEPQEPAPRSLRGLALHSVIYSAAPFLRQLISLGMTRAYTDWLKRPGYGVKDVADMWMMGLQQLLGQNVLGAMVRFYFDHEDERDRARVVTTSTISITLIAWVFCGVAFLFSAELRPLMLGQGEAITGDQLTRILQLMLVLIPFQLSSLSGFYYLQILQRSTLYTTLQTAKLLLEVALNFWFIGHLDWGVSGFLTSMLVGEMVTTVGLTGWLLWTLRPTVDFAILKPIVVYALPLVPAGLCQFGLHQIDKRLLLHFAEPGTAQAVTGVYALGYKIGNLVNAMIIGSFLQIWQPWIFAVKDERERSQLIAQVVSYAVLAFSGASIGVVLFANEGVAILDGDGSFGPAARVVPLVAIGYVFWGVYQAAHLPLLVAKKTLRLLGINAVALVVNVALNATLIPRFGYMGAAGATLATFALLAVLVMTVSRATAGIPFEVGRILLAFALLAAAAAAAHGIDLALVPEGARWGFAAIGAKAVLLGLCALVLWRFALRADERGTLEAWIRARVGS